MVKRQINSFGTITIPKDLREELGISGIAMLRLEVRESNNIKEIVLRKDDDLSEVFDRYKSLAEIISRIAECTVGLVWNNMLMSMSVANNTESFVGKNHPIDTELSKEFKNSTKDSVLSVSKPLNFLPNNRGEVIAYYRIPGTGDDKGFFVLLKGTKQDSDNNISKAEYQRRYEIIADVIHMQEKK